MRLVFSMTNDVLYDQRMQKTCASLSAQGHQVLLIGKNRFPKIPYSNTVFKTRRLNTFFKRGKGFYLEYNLRLFWILLFKKADVFIAVDTDTLLANFLASKLRGLKLGYDAHELFTELEEVVHRPMTKKIWTWVEKICIPKVDLAYTISQGYAQWLETKYGKSFYVVRNVGVKQDADPLSVADRKYILYQGAVNHGRGLEALLAAMQEIDDTLVICGRGDVLDALKKQTKELNIEHKVRFEGYVQPEELKKYTAKAKIGITLFTNDGLSNHYSLCNRFFDYMQAGVPQITIAYPEYINFTKKYPLAHLIQKADAKSITQALQTLLQNSDYYQTLYQASLQARQEVHWQEESLVFKKIFVSSVI